jgi:hypothetical protein
VKAQRSYDPERRLMLAVLENGVNEYLKTAGSSDPARQELFREVEPWIESRDPSSLFSFENICDVLDLDADYLRGGLRGWKQRAVGTGQERHQPAAGRRVGDQRDAA